jgi:L-aminopeptidase/D-esterase-like protein
VRIGHAVAPDGTTGVSVVLFGRAAPTIVDVRGGASGTYDTASLSLDATFGRRWGIFFAGGSVFGLDAGGGLRDAVLADGGGHAVFSNPNRVAPVSGAVLYDLPRGVRRPVDYRELGRDAAVAARPVRPFAGRTGAGAGARIGKYLGRGHSQPGALAIEIGRERGLGTVAALAVLNSVGAVRDPATGRWIAGARDRRGRLVPPDSGIRSAPAGTTLVAVVTDVPVGRPVLQRVGTFVHAGLARAVVPAHTATDGDAVFVSTVAPTESARSGASYAPELADRIGLLAERVTVQAIVRAARAANRATSGLAAGAGSPEGPG